MHFRDPTREPGFEILSRGPRGIKSLVIVGLCFGAASLMVGLFLARHWPYREAAIRSQLSRVASAQVSFRRFHQQYFPPGCVVEDVVLQPANSAQSMATIRRLTLVSTISGFLHHRVGVVRAQGMHLWLERSDLTKKRSSQGTADKFQAEDALVEIRGKTPERSLPFMFRSFSVGRISGTN